MPVMNTRTAGVVDAILSTHARGYRNSEMISHELFPRVTVPSRNMRTIRFGKESFRLLNTRRSPGADKVRIQYGYASDPISLVQDALEATVPVEHQEEAETVPGIDLAAGAVNMVLDVVDLGLEVDAANLARNPANYDANHKLSLVGTDRWTGTASNPAEDVDAAREAIRRSIGRYPNVMVMGPNAFNAATKHALVKENFKYTSADSVTADMLARYFKLQRVVVGAAVYLPQTAAESAPATDVWGDDIVLAYVPTAGTYREPAFAYTYELSGYPQVNQPYFENRSDSWIYPTKVERRPFLVGAEAGFLLQNAGAPAA